MRKIRVTVLLVLCISVMGFSSFVQALPFDFLNDPVSIGPNSISQTVGGVTATTTAYVAQFTGTDSVISGPFPTGPRVFGTELQQQPTPGPLVPVGLFLLSQSVGGITIPADDFGGAVFAPGFDNFNFGPGNVPETEFALFEFSQPVDINQVIVDDTSNFNRSIWVAGGTTAPDFTGDLINAFSGYTILNSADDASDGIFPHQFSQLSSITYLAVGATLPFEVGNLGPFESLVGPNGKSQFFITGLDLDASPIPGPGPMPGPIPGPGPAPAPIPEPSTVLLLGSGLIGLLAIRKRKAN